MENWIWVALICLITEMRSVVASEAPCFCSRLPSFSSNEVSSKVDFSVMLCV